MYRADVFTVDAMRPDCPTSSGEHGGDDTSGLRTVVSGDRRGALWPRVTRLESVLSATGRENANSGPLSGGGQHASGAGRSDGGTVRSDGRGEPPCGPRFDTPVAHGGYAWWYVDALSEDGQYGLTLIAFIGSVFSPYYAWARKRGSGDPMHHCAVNVALYGKRGSRWAMTERGRSAVTRTPSSLCIGRSSMTWEGDTLTVSLDEMTAPWPSRVRGTVTLHTESLAKHVVALDGVGHHRWQPIAPCAQVEVALSHPQLRWSGPGYFDTNSGDAPLEDTFANWQWSRTSRADGTSILYDVCRRDGERLTLAYHCEGSGDVNAFAPPRAVPLPPTRWRVKRTTHSDDGHDAKVLQTLEDAPFYARSLIASRLQSQPAIAIHESLSLDRFRAGWVRMLLPFRMPRRG